MAGRQLWKLNEAGISADNYRDLENSALGIQDDRSDDGLAAFAFFSLLIVAGSQV